MGKNTRQSEGYEVKRVKQGHRHSIIVRLALLVFAMYLTFSMWDVYTELVKDKATLTQMQEEYESVTLQNQELKNLLSSGSEKELIERAARDRLGYVYKGEIVFKQTR